MSVMLGKLSSVTTPSGGVALHSQQQCTLVSTGGAREQQDVLDRRQKDVLGRRSHSPLPYCLLIMACSTDR